MLWELETRGSSLRIELIALNVMNQVCEGYMVVSPNSEKDMIVTGD